MIPRPSLICVKCPSSVFFSDLTKKWPHYPHTLKKSDGDIAITSIRPSITLSPPKPLDEIQLNLVFKMLTWMGCATALFFGPAPWGLGEGPKGQILLNIMKFQLQSQFQRFLNQILFVYSQMKDIKHIRQDFHLATWVLPQGWDMGVPWGSWGVKIFFSEIQPQLVCELLTWMAHVTAQFFGPRPSGALGRGQKVKYY